MCRMPGAKRGSRMELQVAQNAMRIANAGGAPGVFVSGIVWLISGLAWLRLGVIPAFGVLFVGGMAIVPGALFIARVVLRAPKPVVGNPLDRLGLESTFPLFAGLLIAYALLRINPQAVFPVMAITIGARYFTFRTIYGQPIYWLLGSLLVAVGSTAVLGLVTWPINLAILAGSLEVLLAIVLFVRRDATEGCLQNDG